MVFKVRTATANGGTSVISVEGELDLATVAEVVEPAQEAVSQRQPIVIDLSACSFIESAGSRFLFELHNALAEDGTRMAVVACDGQVRKVLFLTAIDQSVRVFAELGDAVEWLRLNGSSQGQLEAALPL